MSTAFPTNKRASIGNGATGRKAQVVLGKENSQLKQRRASVSGEVTKPIQTEEQKPSLHAGFLKEAVVGSKHSYIREQAMEIFDVGYIQSLADLLGAKISAKKFDFSGKDKEQTAMIQKLCTAIQNLKQRQISFAEVCIGIEEKICTESDAMRQAMALAITGKDKANEELKRSTEKSIASENDMTSLRSELHAACVVRDQLQNQSNQLQAAKEVVELGLEKVSNELQQTIKTLDYRTNERDKSREVVEQKKKEIAEQQVARREAEIKLQQAFNEKLDELKQALMEAKVQSKNLQETKYQLEEKLQNQAVKIAAMQGEIDLEKGKCIMLQRECDRYTAEIDSLKSQLQDKGTQFLSAMDGFQRAQRFHEDRITDLSAERKELDSKVASLQELKTDLEQRTHSLESKLEASTRLFETTDSKLQETTALLAKKVEDFTNELLISKKDFDMVKCAALQEAERVQDISFAQLQALQASQAKAKEWEQATQQCRLELETFKRNSNIADAEQLEKLCKMSVEVDFLRQQINGKDNLAKRLMETEAKLVEIDARLYQAETARRNLHNQVQELKGNVRVHVRVRPISEGEVDASFACDDGTTMRVMTEEGKEHNFEFDHVFSQKSSQAEIFDEVSAFVQSALDGYNVCLFSYGQTGSGKTFTMQGANMGDARGIIPRSIEKIMEEATRLESQGWKYKLEVTFLEIYNENVRDLLIDDSSEQSNLQILLNPDGGTHVPDLNRMLITERGQIATVMRQAAKHRSVAATSMNARSSRSHSVFTLHLTGTNEQKNIVLKGTLNLCDLAGSERLDKSGATGDRLKETQSINKSLSCLADVFSSLASKNSHVPYRNSKLTYLLQQCFSAQGKTLMLVNLSPSAESLGESVCSLRFASKVNATELGRPGPKQIKRLAPATVTVPSSVSALGSDIPSPKRKRMSLAPVEKAPKLSK